MKKYFMLTILLTLFSAQLAVSLVPKTINYQGRLSQKTGDPITDGTYSITFKLYNVETGGSALWTGVYDAVTKNGYFNVVLGSGAYPLTSLTFEEQYYLEIRPAGETVDLTPRRPLSSAAYAFHAQSAVEAQSATIAATALHATVADNGVPQGTIIMHQGPSCPTGYTRLSGLDGLFPRAAASFSGTSGAAGGADSHSHGNNTGSGGVAHTHDYSGTTGSNPAISSSTAMSSTSGTAPVWHSHPYSGTTGGASAYSHTHGVAADSNVPSYFNVIFCVKD